MTHILISSRDELITSARSFYITNRTKSTLVTLHERVYYVYQVVCSTLAGCEQEAERCMCALVCAKPAGRMYHIDDHELLFR
jgi:hypothetical protein